MLKAFRKLWNDKRGNALIIVAASLPLIMGSVGLASDTIQWTLWKRELQRAADSAAIAGVYAKVQSASYQNAVTQDLAHNNNVASFTINTNVENSPTTGAYTADAMAVRVLLAARKQLNFSSMFMLSPPTIRATATATIVPTGDYCVISLENTATTGISVGGTANVDLGCGMITNSTSMDAAVAFGNSVVEASPIAAVGGIDASDNWANNVQLLPFTLAQADPFANISPPVPSGSCPNVLVNSNQTATLNPGCYGNMTLRGTVTLNAGTYVLDGGDLVVGAQAVITCNGCVFVLTSRTASTNPTSIGDVTVNAGARLNLSAPTTGTYAGILMYQDRRAPSSTASNYQNHINGNSQSSFQGAFYFPNQQTTFNGTAGMSTACMQLVARRVVFVGTASITNTCPTGSGAQSFEGRAVRLVE
ncbi:MAG: pilus assembly protein TadG-related protein [Sphingomicrobium sp.]